MGITMMNIIMMNITTMNMTMLNMTMMNITMMNITMMNMIMVSMMMVNIVKNRTILNMMIMNMRMINIIMMNMTINFHNISHMSRLIGIMIMYIVRLMRIHPEYCECDYDNRYILCTILFSFPSKTYFSVSWYPFNLGFQQFTIFWMYP